MLLCQLPDSDLDEALESIHGQLQFHFEDLTLQVPTQTVIVSEGYSADLDEGVEDPALW